MTQPQTLTLRRPDDWHVHLRDGAALAAVVGFTARRFGRAIVMPNLANPVTTVQAAREYRQRILDVLPAASRFEPLMTLYLHDAMSPAEIDAARTSGFIHGVKLYPAGATTHSSAGVRNLSGLSGVIDRMQETGLPLLVHGEVTDPAVDIFDREARFIDTVLAPLLQKFQGLKVVFEHITTGHAAQFVRDARAGVAATITPQHLLLNRNALFQGGIRPHHYCLPILKRESDRVALLEAATSGNPKFFLGTDSAPHERATKETACGCAGIFTAHAAIELYAEAFDSNKKLDELEQFASINGSNFYGVPVHTETITLERCEWQVPASYAFAEGELIPYRAGTSVGWKLRGETG